MPKPRPRSLFSIAIAVLPGLPAQAQAIEPQAYEAVYDVFMNGKLRMETRLSATREGDSWLLTNEGKGIKGLARFLNLRSSETGQVRWRPSAVQPLSFTHHSKVAGRDDRWSAQFDWDAGVVETVHEDGTSGLALPAGTVDPLSLTLALRARLEQGESEWRVMVVDEDEIDEHRYAAGGTEPLQTALGCFEVVQLQRIRENSKRYSRGWYAPALGYFPLMMQHGKQGERGFELRIRQLSLGGEAVAGPAECP